MKSTFKDARMDYNQIDEIILTGGCSQIPKINA